MLKRVASRFHNLEGGFTKSDHIAPGDLAIDGRQALHLGRTDHVTARGGLDLLIAARMVGVPMGIEDQGQLPAQLFQFAQDDLGVGRVDAGGQASGVITDQIAVIV